jgi:hypothetical protein
LTNWREVRLIGGVAPNQAMKHDSEVQPHPNDRIRLEAVEAAE